MWKCDVVEAAELRCKVEGVRCKGREYLEIGISK
jgi:hypothetical protein